VFGSTLLQDFAIPAKLAQCAAGPGVLTAEVGKGDTESDDLVRVRTQAHDTAGIPAVLASPPMYAWMSVQTASRSPHHPSDPALTSS
jgi:hypothetical protein